MRSIARTERPPLAYQCFRSMLKPFLVSEQE
jgi:hypothetical protein